MDCLFEIYQAQILPGGEVEFIRELPVILSPTVDSDQKSNFMIDALPVESLQVLKESCLFSFREKQKQEFDLKFAINQRDAIYHVMIQPAIDLVQVILCDLTRSYEQQMFREEILAVVAHDIRSPFVGILGFLELFMEKLEEVKDKCDSEKLEFMSSIQKILPQLQMATRGQYLLSTTLLSWAINPLQNSKKVVFDLNQMIVDSISLASSLCKERKIYFNYNNDAPVDFFGHPETLQIALDNLISNCIKFTEDCGSIAVIFQDSTDCYQIIVQDTGVGMSPEELKKLFTFQPTRKDGLRGEKSNGVGLYLCADILKSFGYSITVESQLGKGSSFTIKVPKE